MTKPVSPKHYDYIDALRGWAILMVILVHTYGSIPALPEYLKTIFTEGARGVQLFFVLSAFTLMLSWHSRGNYPVAFYIRRFFRIAPLFWLAITIYTIVQGMGPSYWAPNGIGWPTIILTFLFMHGWHPETINSVVPGGWSIAVEMNFYLLFPLFARYITSIKRAFVLLVCVTLVAKYSNGALPHLFDNVTLGFPHDMLVLYAMLWLVNQLPAFATGILVYYLLQQSKDMPKKYSVQILIAGLVYLFYLCFHGSPWMMYCFSFAFGTILFALAQGSGRILVNRLTVFIGKVSYSAYLCQFILIDYVYKYFIDQKYSVMETYPTLFFVIGYTLITILIVIVSYGLHLAIEKPMISFGHSLAKRWSPVS